jgi:hypothetical protein
MKVRLAKPEVSYIARRTGFLIMHDTHEYYHLIATLFYAKAQRDIGYLSTAVAKTTIPKLAELYSRAHVAPSVLPSSLGLPISSSVASARSF